MSDPSAGNCHGHLASQIVEACRKRGLFELLDVQEFRGRTWLIEQLGANEGYFAIALEVLQSLGWIEADGDGALRRTGKADEVEPAGDASALTELLFGDRAHEDP